MFPHFEHLKEISLLDVAENTSITNLRGIGTMIYVLFSEGFGYVEGGDMFECCVRSVDRKVVNLQNTGQIIKLISCRDRFSFPLDPDDADQMSTCMVEYSGLGYFKWNGHPRVVKEWRVSFNGSFV